MNPNSKLTIQSVFSFMGGLSGLLSIGLIIWKGGVLWQMVNEHERRLNGIEIGGSIGLREHVKLDDERVRELQVQEALDATVRQKLLDGFSTLTADVKVINSKLDSLKEQITLKK